MQLSGLSLIRLTDDHTFKPFDCEDEDLNDFLLNNSKKFLSALLAVTYLIESDLETVAFFSIFNDKVTYADFPSKNQWVKFRKGIVSSEKQYKSYPAVKIGRLGVTATWKGKQIGTAILDYLKELLVDENIAGCKLITVDAYRASLVFYEKNEFKFLTSEDLDDDTRLMFYNLKKS